MRWTAMCPDVLSAPLDVFASRSVPSLKRISIVPAHLFFRGETLRRLLEYQVGVDGVMPPTKTTSIHFIIRAQSVSLGHRTAGPWVSSTAAPLAPTPQGLAFSDASF
jgi:hypothetical protein